MKTRDLIKTSQVNLVRSKLRTSLTILAVFIGTFTISITTGVGNGVKAYVNKELGNVGVKNAFVVQAKSDQANPLSSEVKKYDPDQKKGSFNAVLLSNDDITRIQSVKDVTKVTPNFRTQIDYITLGNDKFQAQAAQFIPGLNLDMAAGRVIDLNNPDEVTIPVRYVGPLGLANATAAVGQHLTIGYKNSRTLEVEKVLTIVGVQQESILGNSSIYLTPSVAAQIQADQTAGIANLENTYDAFIVEFDPALPASQIEELKQVLLANNYSAQTIQDQIGSFSKIINGISVGLNVFGIVALLVAAFGIVNTLLMAVNERTSEIGLMKALGANSRTVFAIFSLEAASIGFWGGLLGLAVSIGVGTILSKYAASHFLKDFTGFNLLAFPPIYSIAILVGIIVLAFLAGTLPSLKASRLDPIKALRYE